MRNLARALALTTSVALAGVSVPATTAAQRKLTFEFDASLAEEEALTAERRSTLAGKIPSWMQLPDYFDTLETAPNDAVPPTITIWLFPEVREQFERMRTVNPSVLMTKPAPLLCASSSTFTAPTTSLLAPGAPSACTAYETQVKAKLTAEHLVACLDLEEPERYVHASRLPPGLSKSELIAASDAHTETLEEQIAFVGAGLAEVPPPAGLLPPDWLTTLRHVLWKIRPFPTTRLANARTALGGALSLLDTQASCFAADQRSSLRGSLEQLKTELDAVQAHVEDVVLRGTQRAQNQQQCLEAQGRTRPTLPYPALTDEEREFIGYWLGGIYWRLRGGGFVTLDSTHSYRTFFARRPFREIARVANGTEVAQQAADAIYCNVFAGWGTWFDMGTSQGSDSDPENGHDTYYDLVQMTNRGRQQVADFPAGSYACLLYAPGVNKGPEVYLREAGYDSTALFAGGLSMGPCYLYGLYPLRDFTYFTQEQAPSPYSNLFQGFTTLGEFCTGASLGLGLTRSLLEGRPSGQPPTSFCATRQCGVDACGNSCGTCAPNVTCTSAGTCESATSSTSEEDDLPNGDSDAPIDNPSDGTTLPGGDGDADSTLSADDEVAQRPASSGCQATSPDPRASWLVLLPALWLSRRRFRRAESP